MAATGPAGAGLWRTAAQRIQLAAVVIVLAGIALVIALAIWLATGGFDVAASTPHGRLSYWTIHSVLIRTVRARSNDIKPPTDWGPARAIAGFRQYDAQCVRCHGAPGVARSVWANLMDPSPPYLSDAPRRFTDAQLFWIVCHGVKMTGMPAWGSHRSDDDIWNLVAFLRTLPDTSAQDYTHLRSAYAGPDPSGQAGAPDAACLAKS